MVINGNATFHTLGSGEVRNAIIERVATNPGTTVAGRIVYNTTDNYYYWHNGTAWMQFSSAGSVTALQTEVDNIESALGAGINSSGVFQAGGFSGATYITSPTSFTNAILQLDSAINSNNTLAEMDDVSFTGLASGDVIYYNGTAWVNAAPGATSGVQPYDADLTTIAGLSGSLTKIKRNAGDTAWTAVADTFDSLNDVVITSPATNHIVYYDGADWINATPATVTEAAVALTNLSNVTVPTPSTNDVLQYNGTAWVNATPASIAGTISLDNLSDVIITSVASGNVLYYNGSAWVNAAKGSTSGVQAWDIALDDFSTLGAVAADQLPYGSAANTYSFTTFTSFARTLLDDSSASAMRTTLGLVSGGTGDIWVDTAGDTMSGNLNMAGNSIINVATPVAGGDAVNKNYVDAAINGLYWKNPVRATSTGNITLSAPGASIDGVTMASGNRFLAKNQTTASENGIYVWNGAASAATRAADQDQAAEFSSSAVWTQEGTVNADTGWVCTTDDPITVGTTSIAFVQFSGSNTYVAGVGLALTGNTFSVNLGAGIFELPTDEVGIELHDGSTGAIILTTDGTTRSTASASKLHLLLESNKGLAQGSGGLAISYSNLASATSTGVDAVMFFDDSDSDNPKYTTLDNFFLNNDVLTDTGGANPLTASDGIIFASQDLQLNIGGLSDVAVVGADEMVFHDVSASGTHIKRTITNFLADRDIVNNLGGNGFAVQTAGDTYTARTITAATGEDGGLDVTNGNGVAGNPIIGLNINGTTLAGENYASGDLMLAYNQSANANQVFTLTELKNGVTGAMVLDDISNVDLTGAADGDLLVYNGTNWVDQKCYHLHTQGSAATTWTITHNLNQQYCNVTVVDSGDQVIIPDSITFTSSTVVTITFNTGITGKAVVMGIA